MSEPSQPPPAPMVSFRKQQLALRTGARSAAAASAAPFESSAQLSVFHTSQANELPLHRVGAIDGIEGDVPVAGVTNVTHTHSFRGGHTTRHPPPPAPDSPPDDFRPPSQASHTEEKIDLMAHQRRMAELDQMDQQPANTNQNQLQPKTPRMTHGSVLATPITPNATLSLRDATAFDDAGANQMEDTSSVMNIEADQPSSNESMIPATEDATVTTVNELSTGAGGRRKKRQSGGAGGKRGGRRRSVKKKRTSSSGAKQSVEDEGGYSSGGASSGDEEDEDETAAVRPEKKDDQDHGRSKQQQTSYREREETSKGPFPLTDAEYAAMGAREHKQQLALIQQTFAQLQVAETKEDAKPMAREFLSSRLWNEAETFYQSNYVYSNQSHDRFRISQLLTIQQECSLTGWSILQKKKALMMVRIADIVIRRDNWTLTAQDETGEMEIYMPSVSQQFPWSDKDIHNWYGQRPRLGSIIMIQPICGRRLVLMRENLVYFAHEQPGAVTPSYILGSLPIPKNKTRAGQE